jgi:3-oxoacyl-[acyl-carrier protein] reductase
MFAAARSDHGRVDILVNNAGIDNAAPLAQVSDERWAEMLRVNLTGVFLCTREAFAPMCAHGWGRIISVGSQVALKGAVELSHYCAAKAGVHGLMRAVALEGAPFGVTANVIAPGPVDTELLRSLPEEWRKAKKAEVPLGRFATPDEIAPTAVLLASDGGAYYTGSTMNVSGGDVII